MFIFQNSFWVVNESDFFGIKFGVFFEYSKPYQLGEVFESNLNDMKEYGLFTSSYNLFLLHMMYELYTKIL